jgi:hypothetical protein
MGLMVEDHEGAGFLSPAFMRRNYAAAAAKPSGKPSRFLREIRRRLAERRNRNAREWSAEE